jgi:hypothetical protein
MELFLANVWILAEGQTSWGRNSAGLSGEIGRKTCEAQISNIIGILVGGIF